MAKEYESGSIRRTTIVPPRIIEPSKREWKIGERIANRYQIFKIIEGGMGVLYFCYDREAKEPVAIKTFKERGILDLNIIELFRSEALTWVRLGKHKNIVQAKYVVDIGKKTYIFLEYIVSETEPTLRTLLRKGRLELDYTLNLAIQFCDGMIYATKVIPGLIHRDIKPENILVTQDGVLKITDFGLTKVFFDLSTEIGSIVGTIPYMSPEQCLGLKVFDIRSDIYSFGIVIYEMLAGRHPFNATSKLEFLYHHIVTNPTEVKVLNPSLSRDINDIVMKCLRKKPEERFQNFTELKKTLLNFYSGKIIESFGTEIPSSRIGTIEAQTLLSKGVSLSTLGRYDEAITFFDTALNADPDYIEAYYRKGTALIGLGQYDEAIVCFDRYLDTDPRDTDVLNHKGALLNLQGKREEAISCFNKALSVHPWHYEVLYNKGVTLFLLGRYDEAATCIKRVKEVSPNKTINTLLEICSKRTVDNDNLNFNLSNGNHHIHS